MKTNSIFRLSQGLFLLLCICTNFLSCGGSGGSGNFQSVNALLPVTTEKCSIVLPAPNAELLNLLEKPDENGSIARLHWRIQYVSPDGHVVSKQENFIKTGQTVQIEFAQSRPTPVLAFLVINDAETLMPAGAIYPVNKTDNIIDVSWLNGISAQILTDLLTKTDQSIEDSQHLCDYFNWQKFQQEFAKRIQKPWLVNQQKILEKICTGSFSVSTIKEEKSYEDVLPENSLEWLCAPYGDTEAIYAGETAYFALSSKVYLSSRGTVLVEKKSSSKNTIIITELAR